MNLDQPYLRSNLGESSHMRLFTFHVKHHTLFRGLDGLARYDTRGAILLQIFLELKLFLAHLLGLLDAEVIRKQAESLVDR